MEPLQEEYFYYDKKSIIGVEIVLVLGILITILFYYQVPLLPWYAYLLGIVFDSYLLYLMQSYYIRRWRPALRKQWILKIGPSGITNPLVFGHIPWSVITKMEYRYTHNTEGANHYHVDIYITDAKAYYAYNNENPIDGSPRYKKVYDNCIRLCTDLFKVENKEDVFDALAVQLEYYTGITS